VKSFQRVIGVTAFRRDLKLSLEAEGWLIMPTPTRYDEVLRCEQNRYFEMDAAFCARMRKAIEAGLESAPIGVVTTPGTKNPKYVSDEG